MQNCYSLNPAAQVEAAQCKERVSSLKQLKGNSEFMRSAAMRLCRSREYQSIYKKGLRLIRGQYVHK